MLGLVPSIVKAWRSTGCMAGLNWTALKCFSSTGEASSPDDYTWLMSRVRGYRPVIEYCGGTELGGGYVSCSLLQPQAPSAFSMPTLGSCWVLATADGAQLQPSETPTPLSAPASAASPPVSGEVMLVPPMLGSSQRLLNADHDKVYYKDMPRHSATGRLLRRHGDELAVMILQLPARSLGGDGRAAAAASAATTAVPYYVALGRCDDTMNLGGIKISSVELERAVERNVADVAEVAAVGVPTPGGGPERLHLFVVLKQLQPNQPSKKASTAAAPSTTAAAAGGNSSLSGGHSPSAVSATADTVGTDTADVASSVAALKKACQAAISRHLSPLFKVDAVVVAPSLPRTASNKVMRRLLRGMAMRGGSLVASSVMAASAAQQTAAATTTRSKL